MAPAVTWTSIALCANKSHNDIRWQQCTAILFGMHKTVQIFQSVSSKAVMSYRFRKSYVTVNRINATSGNAAQGLIAEAEN